MSRPVPATSAPASRQAEGLGLEPAHHGRELIVVLDHDPVLDFWADEVSTFIAVLRAQRAFASVEVKRLAVEDGVVWVTGSPTRSTPRPRAWSVPPASGSSSW